MRSVLFDFGQNETSRLSSHETTDRGVLFKTRHKAPACDAIFSMQELMREWMLCASSPLGIGAGRGIGHERLARQTKGSSCPPHSTGRGPVALGRGAGGAGP